MLTLVLRFICAGSIQEAVNWLLRRCKTDYTRFAGLGRTSSRNRTGSQVGELLYYICTGKESNRIRNILQNKIQHKRTHGRLTMSHAPHQEIEHFSTLTNVRGECLLLGEAER